MSDFSLDEYLQNYNDEYDKLMISSAYSVIDRLEAWTIIKNYGSDSNNNFMFSNNEQISNIMSSINKEYEGHSGASLAITMRNMYQISLLK